ncbi:MAG: ABC transporter ATP-binding protein [Thermoanaerobaculia bacterium]|nr:ABC transporter ATP-binding protein [Thermoanaerobaculia bacterium]
MGARVLVEGVSKRYGGDPSTPRTEALHEVSFELLPGSFTALLGPSGCGKSTLLNLVGALDKPTSGRILVDGLDIVSRSEPERDTYRRRTAATIFQFFNLLSTMTVVENVSLPLLLDGVPPRRADDAARQTLTEVGLDEKLTAFPYQLSGGQMQRVAIARALVVNPALLLADEPTGNLDSRTGNQVLDLIEELVSARGLTVVMATHSEAAAARATRILHLLDGRLVAAS